MTTVTIIPKSPTPNGAVHTDERQCRACGGWAPEGEADWFKNGQGFTLHRRCPEQNRKPRTAQDIAQRGDAAIPASLAEHAITVHHVRTGRQRIRVTIDAQLWQRAYDVIPAASADPAAVVEAALTALLTAHGIDLETERLVEQLRAVLNGASRERATAVIKALTEGIRL